MGAVRKLRGSTQREQAIATKQYSPWPVQSDPYTLFALHLKGFASMPCVAST